VVIFLATVARRSKIRLLRRDFFRMTLILSITPLLPDSLSWLSMLLHHLMHLVLTGWLHLILTVLARKSRLSCGATTMRTRWAEVHNNRCRHFIVYLVTSTCMNFLLMRLLISTAKVFSASNSCSLFNVCLAAYHLLEATVRIVTSSTIALDLSLTRWPCVGHRRIALTWNMASDR